ncbi:MAG: SH3 domain-containing protein, partial [Nesterenkonia sp.]|nr:SH3 domain-containing protein [Nesterenkonia sp.]
PSQPEGVEPAEDSDLPGQSVLTYFSRTGAEAQVIRVGHEDQLNVRSLPGATEDPITTLRPDGEVELAGRERLLGSNSWAEIALDEGVGWVNTYYLGYLGEAEDVTEDYSDLGPASVPRAAVDMVTSRAAAAARDETRYAYSDLTGAPPEDGLEAREQEWTVDLTTPGDDAVLGDRLSVRLEREDDTYGITDVERTPICLRGASDGGCL